METATNGKAPAANEGHFQNHHKCPKHNIPRLTAADELDPAEHVEIESPTRAKNLHDAERDAKVRLRDAIQASGVSYGTGVGLFSLNARRPADLGD